LKEYEAAAQRETDGNAKRVAGECLESHQRTAVKTTRAGRRLPLVRVSGIDYCAVAVMLMRLPWRSKTTMPSINAKQLSSLARLTLRPGLVARAAPCRDQNAAGRDRFAAGTL